MAVEAIGEDLLGFLESSTGIGSWWVVDWVAGGWGEGREEWGGGWTVGNGTARRCGSI